MSIPRLLTITAVPYNWSCLQPFINQNMKKTVPNFSTHDNELKNRLKPTTLTSAKEGSNRNRLLKKKERSIKNRISSQVSREKAKLKQKLLEKQIFDLEVEQMKIRMLNDTLEKKQAELAQENALLKLRLCKVNSPLQPKNSESSVKTLKQAEEVGLYSSFLTANYDNRGFIKQHPASTSFNSFEHKDSTYCDKVSETTDNFSSSFIAKDHLVSTSFNSFQHKDSSSYDKISETTDTCSSFMTKVEFLGENEMDFVGDIDMIESFIFGDSPLDLPPVSKNCQNNTENEVYFSENSLFSKDLEKSELLEGAKIPINENSLLPQWTFENLFDDLQDNFLDFSKICVC